MIKNFIDEHEALIVTVIFLLFLTFLILVTKDMRDGTGTDDIYADSEYNIIVSNNKKLDEINKKLNILIDEKNKVNNVKTPTESE